MHNQTSLDKDKQKNEVWFELIEKAVSGDEDAFAQLYARNAKSIRWHAESFLSDKSEIDDVVQEIAFKLYKSISRLKAHMRFARGSYRLFGRSARITLGIPPSGSSLATMKMSFTRLTT